MLPTRSEIFADKVPGSDSSLDPVYVTRSPLELARLGVCFAEAGEDLFDGAEGLAMGRRRWCMSRSI